MYIKRNEVLPLIKELKNGTIFSAVFIKKDGTVRTMNTIKGTRKGIVGRGLKFNPSDRNLLPVFNLQLRRKKIAENKCWRMININTVQKIKKGKVEYIVIE